MFYLMFYNIYHLIYIYFLQLFLLINKITLFTIMSVQICSMI